MKPFITITSEWKPDRRFFTATAAGLVLVGASCTQQQVDDNAQKLADLIQQVQAGVRSFCAAVGTIIPTANTVIGVIAAIAGTTNPAIVTAAMIAQAVSQIAAVGCPQPQGPAAKPAKSSVTVNGKTVPIEFY